MLSRISSTPYPVASTRFSSGSELKALTEILNNHIVIPKPGELLSPVWKSYTLFGHTMKLRLNNANRSTFQPQQFMKLMKTLGYLPEAGETMSVDTLFEKIRAAGARDAKDLVLKILGFGYFSNTLKVQIPDADAQSELGDKKTWDSIAELLGGVFDTQFSTFTVNPNTQWKNAAQLI